MKNQRVTLADIAAVCGVSVMSVSRALSHGKGVSRSLQSRVRQQAEALGWRPDPALAALVRYRHHDRSESRQGETLAFLAPAVFQRLRQTQGTIYQEIYEGVATSAAQHGYQLNLIEINRGGSNLAKELRTLYHRGVRGILMNSSLDLPMIQPEMLASFSVVMIGSGSWRYPFHAVRNDFFQMTQCALRALVKRGYRRMGYLATETDERTNMRPLGALRAEAELTAGLQASVLPENVWNSPDTARFFHWLDEFQPDALVSVANPLGIRHKLRGLRVPEDLGVVQLNRPFHKKSVTGIVSDLNFQGKLAVQRLHQLLLDNETGVPEHRSTLRVDGYWDDGGTVRELDTGSLHISC